MGRQVIVSAAPPGSQRKRDYTWPDPNVNMTGAPSTIHRGRYGGSTGTTGSTTNGTTGNQVMGFVNGVPCARLTNGINLVGGPTAIFDNAMRLHPCLFKTGIKYGLSIDDYAAIRAYALMRVTANPTTSTDVGFECILGANASLGVQSSAQPGWFFRYDTGGTVSWVLRGNSGALTATQISPSVASGFLNTDWHMSEFRLFSATPTTDAQLKILFDNQVVLIKSWGVPGDDLPTPNSPGANNNNGFVLNAQYQSQNGELDVALVRCQMAPTENALF